MVWLQPAAWLGLIALAAPVLIHLLVHRRAPALLFPTLRFVAPTRLASMRRHLLDDVPLLVIRGAVLAAATAALAGPLLVTPSRRAAWLTRVARAAIVDDDTQIDRAREEVAGVFRGTVISAPTIGEGLRRAAAWMADLPAAKREIVALSPFPIGSLTPGDVAAVPPAIGLRFERVGRLPSSATVAAQPSLGLSSTRGRAARYTPSVVLEAERTRIVDAGAADVALPIEIDASDTDRRAIDAALSSVLAGRVSAAAANRTVRFVLAGSPGFARIVGEAAPIRQAWMADAVAAIARDADWARAARTAAATLDDSRLSRPPWHPLAGRAQPLAAAASAGDRLLVVSLAPPTDLATPILLRAVLNGLAPADRAARPEVVATTDAALRTWERPASSSLAPSDYRLEDDDRRWLWATVLLLLALEAWMRRARATRATERDDLNGSDGIADVA